MVQRSSKLHHPWMISLRHGWWVSATLYLSIDHHLAYINTINQKYIHDTAPFRITASMDDQSSPPYICQLTSSRVYSYSISKMYIWYSAFSNYIIHLDDVIRKGAVSYHSRGWRRHIEYLKMQVIFRKRTTNTWALLSKMIYKDKASYESSPLCISQLIVFSRISIL